MNKKIFLIIIISFLLGRVFSMALVYDYQNKYYAIKQDYDNLYFQTENWRKLSEKQKELISGNNFFGFPGKYIVNNEGKLKPGRYSVEYHENAILKVNDIEYNMCIDEQLAQECQTKIMLDLKNDDVIEITGGNIKFIDDNLEK